MIAIVVSRADSASEHIGDRLRAIEDWTRHEDPSRPDAAGGGTYYRTNGFELREFDDLHIELSNPAAAFGGSAGADANSKTAAELDFLVFVSRHSGETGPLLTAHVTGNFGPATYGGQPETLALAAPGAVKRVVDGLATHAPDGYDVGIECTHHGPTDTTVPSLFVEVGSDEPQWGDPAAATAAARAVLDLRETGPALTGADGRPRHVVGFGGGHYAPRFTRIVRETDWAVGHVGADWALDEMGAPGANRETVAAAFERSDAHHAVIEGTNPDLRAVIEALGHRVVSETWVRAVDDRPLALVESLESTMTAVDEGLRFGSVTPAVEPDGPAGNDLSTPTGPSHSVGGDPSVDEAPSPGESLDQILTVRSLPAGLLSRAQGLDGEAARTAVETNTVAFETEQAGTRAAGVAAFVADGATPGYEDLIIDLAAVLESGYDEVTIQWNSEGSVDDGSSDDGERDGVVIAQKAAFDPELAAMRGVPEGPAFGRLANGEAVELDGETIRPEAVSRETEDRFPIPSN
ncbi:MAG: D-aminoacyl-tRNA deacylase [Halorubrum sp.]